MCVLALLGLSFPILKSQFRFSDVEVTAIQATIQAILRCSEK